MMRIDAVQVVDVQRDAGVVDEALEELVQEINVEITDPGAREVDAPFESGATGESMTTRDNASSSGTYAWPYR